VGHGDFISWIEENVRAFGERTARNLMAFAERCDRAGLLEEYHPGKTATVAELEEPGCPHLLLNCYLEDMRGLRHELVDLDLELDRATTAAECNKIRKAAERLQRRAARLHAQCEHEAARLRKELTDFFGFPVSDDDLPMITTVCQERIAELGKA